LRRLLLADPDNVDLTNLQRQILYRTESVGRRKVDAARETLAALNAEVEVHVLPKKLDAEDLHELVSGCDIVLDCSDNFATRHAVNRACVRHSKPLVSGAAIRFDGQLMVFDFRDRSSPCYACLFPEEGESEEMRCAVMGVLAPLTGVIGALQAMEAIKLIAQVGERASSRLLVFDAQKTEWRSIKTRKDPACRVCGNRGQAPISGTAASS
jgi:adenylyltransferase/sulfurtransferase